MVTFQRAGSIVVMSKVDKDNVWSWVLPDKAITTTVCRVPLSGDKMGMVLEENDIFRLNILMDLIYWSLVHNLV